MSTYSPAFRGVGQTSQPNIGLWSTLIVLVLQLFCIVKVSIGRLPRTCISINSNTVVNSVPQFLLCNLNR